MYPRIMTVSSFTDLELAMRGSVPGEDLLIINSNVLSAQEFVYLVHKARAGAADYDRTMTFGSQWLKIEECLLRPDLAKINREEAEAYFDGQMRRDADDINFLLTTIERLRDSSVHRDMFESLVRDALPRDGSIAYMNSFVKRRGPHDPRNFAFISMGMWDWMYPWMHLFAPDLLSDVQIYGLKLHWDKRSMLAGCDLDTNVTDGNKGHKFATHCVVNRLDPRKVPFVGDSAQTDYGALIQGLGILLVPDDEDEQMFVKHRQGDQLEKLWDAGVAGVLCSSTFDTLVGIRAGRVVV